MNRHVSILMWLSRSSFWKLFLLLGISAGVQAVWFFLVLSGNPLASLEELAGGGSLAVPFLVCFLLVSALLSATGCEMGTRSGYTLRRLSVSERTVFAWQWGYNSACFLLLWLAELLTAFGLCTLYTMKADPSLVSGQTLFLAFYRNALLHALLPLEDAFLWIRNLLFILTMGAACAVFSYRQRRGRLGWEIAAVCMTVLFAFPSELGQWEWNIIALALLAFLLLEICVFVWGKEGSEDEKREV